MYFLQSEKATYGINLPTSLDELTPEVLYNLTKDIKLSNNYTLICLAYKTTLFQLASDVNAGLGKDGNINVIPLIAKTDSVQYPVKECIANRPIIAPSVLERGYEVFIPTAASLQAVVGYLQHDNELRVELFQKKYKGNLKDYKGVITDDVVIKDNSTPIYILGFKIVHNNDIVAINPIHQEIEDAFYVNTSLRG